MDCKIIILFHKLKSKAMGFQTKAVTFPVLSFHVFHEIDGKSFFHRCPHLWSSTYTANMNLSVSVLLGTLTREEFCQIKVQDVGTVLPKIRSIHINPDKTCPVPCLLPSRQLLQGLQTH